MTALIVALISFLYSILLFPFHSLALTKSIVSLYLNDLLAIFAFLLMHVTGLPFSFSNPLFSFIIHRQYFPNRISFLFLMFRFISWKFQFEILINSAVLSYPLSGGNH